MESKSVPTATNAAYGVVSHDQSSSGDVAMYEIVGQPPSSSARPTAHPPFDYQHSSQGPPLTDSPYDVIAKVERQDGYVDDRYTLLIFVFVFCSLVYDNTKNIIKKRKESLWLILPSL